MAVSAISGLSAASMKPISSVQARQVRPEAYAIDNKSEISDAFAETMAAQSVQGVMAPTPVQYANAQVEENTISAAEESSRTNRMFNNIAAAYQGMNTSYDSNGAAFGYGMVGNSIDLMA